MKYRKKPVVIEARQWFMIGDDESVKPYYDGMHAAVFRPCKHCGEDMSVHGRIETLEGEHIVCPGDYIITDVKGEKYPCKPDIFEMTHERIDTV